MKRLFGTDGIRGKAGVFPLDGPTVSRIGSALASTLREGAAPPRILIGRDTRESGAWIEEDLARGIAAAGGEPTLMGVMTTAGVAHLTRTSRFDAGVVISASHNPFSDNGIKVFSRDGYKLPDDQEARIESIVLHEDRAEAEPPSGLAEPAGGAASGRWGRRSDLGTEYVHRIVAAAGGTRLDGFRVVLDCANGASYEAAPAVFEALGAAVQLIAGKPDGTNINNGCGSVHPDALCRTVVEAGADAGFAFDGDADRCILSDERGTVCDGDFILWRLALAMRADGKLAEDLVVGTVMANLWLERALQREGIRLLRTPVGDKYVLEEMLRTGSRLGGEQSGHVIFLEHGTTGDGILTAVMMACTIRRAGVALSAWRSEVKPFPQILLNERVSSRPDLETHPVIGPAAEAVREKLGRRGRLLLRYSGTESLARVMIESEDAEQTEVLAHELAGVIRQEIGEG